MKTGSVQLQDGLMFFISKFLSRQSSIATLCKQGPGDLFPTLKPRSHIRSRLLERNRSRTHVASYRKFATFQRQPNTICSKCSKIHQRSDGFTQRSGLLTRTSLFYRGGISRYGSSPLTDPENKGQRQQGVNFDTIGSWNNRISMQIMVEESIRMGKLIPEIPLDEVGTASLLGRRRVNEDRFVVTRLSPDILYFGIFDGHGGGFAADFVSNHMIDHMTFWLQKTDDISEVLRQSFIDINNLLIRHLNYHFMDSSEYNTGTTATVCLLRHGIELYIGHVGDTRAILSREGRPVRLTEDHHPENKSEKERILKKGGIVTSNSLGVHQVNGRLSMTRSIGDTELKSHGVTASPYLKSKTLKHGKDAFLILTTDGLSFVLSDREVVDIVSSCSKPQDAATFITDQALQFGTEDNTTSVVIPLGAWGKYRSATRAIPYSIGRNLVGGRFG